jgi:hypothetical protein
LPTTGAVLALETADGKPQLVTIHASEIVSNTHAGSNLARGLVYAGPRATIEIQGASASTSLVGHADTYYVKISGDDAEVLRSRLHLIRLTPNKERRVVIRFSQNVFGRQRTKTFDDVAITKADEVPDTWLRVTPDAPLAAGEYGMVFMPKDAGTLPTIVYDFSVR